MEGIPLRPSPTFYYTHFISENSFGQNEPAKHVHDGEPASVRRRRRCSGAGKPGACETGGRAKKKQSAEVACETGNSSERMTGGCGGLDGWQQGIAATKGGSASHAVVLEDLIRPGVGSDWCELTASCACVLCVRTMFAGRVRLYC